MSRATSPLAAAVVVLGLCAGALAAPDGLSGREEAALKQQLAEAVQGGAWDRVADLVPRLARKNDKKTWELLVRVVERAPADTACASSLRAAAKAMDGRGVQEAVRKAALESRSLPVRRALVHHVAAQQDWPALVALLGDADEQVASPAAWALVDGRVESAVEPLISLMERLDPSHDGIWAVLRDGLGQLLGARLGSGAEYRARWQALEGAGGLASVAAPAPGPVEIDRADRVIDETRLVFILDISGSMAEVDPEPEARDGGIPEPRPAGMTRLLRAQRELRRVISSLPETTRLNIVAYSSPDSVLLWKLEDGAPRLYPMTERNKRDACEFVERFRADGTTATDLALERAFEVEGARCFYLVSGGEASHDGLTSLPTAEVLAVIDAKGKDRRVTIHTLGFVGVERETLIALARRTGGKYSDIR